MGCSECSVVVLLKKTLLIKTVMALIHREFCKKKLSLLAILSIAEELIKFYAVCTLKIVMKL